MPSAGLQPPPSGSAPSAPSVAPAGSSASAPSAWLQPPPSAAENFLAETFRRQIVEDVLATGQTWMKPGWEQWYDNDDFWTDDK